MSFRSRAWTAAAILAMVTGCGGDAAEEPADEGAEVSGSMDSLAVGETPDVPRETAGGTASGQTVFTTNCATCHGEQGRGNGPAAVGLEPPPADLSDATWTTGDGSLAAIRNVIENGSPGTAMIAWKGTLTDEQIGAVAGYVHSMGGGR